MTAEDIFFLSRIEIIPPKDIFLVSRVGSITAEDIISFTVSNYDALDAADNGEDNVWNARSAKKKTSKKCEITKTTLK